jgi:hypothetical protein
MALAHLERIKAIITQNGYCREIATLIDNFLTRVLH